MKETEGLTKMCVCRIQQTKLGNIIFGFPIPVIYFIITKPRFRIINCTSVNLNESFDTSTQGLMAVSSYPIYLFNM